MTRAATHGAADVLVGALAARLADGDPLPDALRYANAAAALHVGTDEARRGRVSSADVRRLIAESLPDDAAASLE